MGEQMIEAMRWPLLTAGMFFTSGTFLSLSSHPHWFVRGWDFPRPQLGVILGAIGAGYLATFGASTWWEFAFLVFLAAAFLDNVRRIAPYTRLAAPMVADVANPDSSSSLRVLISNVQMENDRSDLVLAAVREADPDLVLLVEADRRWQERVDVLVSGGSYPYCALRPQDNHYGMCLYSRLELIEHEVLTLVQEDVPSIHARLRLRCGQEINFHGVHPRPPEPARNQDSVPRDAELVLLAELAAAESDPTIVAGDLNDVAWSATTSLFLRLSEMVDPRVGRGFYNTWNANTRWLRLALDHVFHSDHFELARLEILGSVGSDHFPVLAELQVRPNARAEPATPQDGDPARAGQKLRRAGKAVTGIGTS